MWKFYKCYPGVRLVLFLGIQYVCNINAGFFILIPLTISMSFLINNLNSPSIFTPFILITYI